MRFDAHQYRRGFAERISEETLPEHFPVRETSAFWSTRRKQHALPGRQDIDPVDLGAKLFPRVFLTDVVDANDGMAFRFRLAGISNARLTGIAPGGPLASDIFVKDRSIFMMAGYRDTVTKRAVKFRYVRTSGGRHAGRLVFHGLFPLAPDGTHADILLGIRKRAKMHPIEERALAVSAHAI